jgi:hypothetical protein
MRLYSGHVRKIIATIKQGLSRRPREIESVLAFECSMRWDQLLEINGDESERFCTSCSKNVFLTVSDLAYQENAKRGRCVSIPAGTKLKIKGKEVTTHAELGGAPAYDRRDRPGGLFD